MGILALIIGVVVVLAVIGIGVMYMAAMLILAAFGVSAMVAFAILYAVLGEDHVGIAMLLALPAGLLGVRLFIKDFKGEA